MTSRTQTKTHQIRLTKLVQSHFYTFWKTKRPYSILLGGRGSFKSSTTSLKLLVQMKRQIQQGHRANVIVVRENATNLRDSVYKQVSWAIDMLGMTDEFIYRVNPMTITHRRTGSTFYFYGADKPERLKSNTVGDVIAVWYEEAANFKGPEVFDQANPTFIRQKSPWVDQVFVIWTYNPPKSPYEWINKWVDSLRDNHQYLIDKSTYLDDKLGFTTDQQLDLIEQYKATDYDYYSWLYLGKEIGLGTNVYNMQLFKRIDAIPPDDRISCLLVAVDNGHSQSATAAPVVALMATGRVIVLDTYYYSPAGKAVKKAVTEQAAEVHEFLQRVESQYSARILNRTNDSADGAFRNQYYHDYHINWHPVHKLKEADMIDYVQNLMAQGRLFYLDTPGNKVLIDEHQQYQWDPKTVQLDDPKVIKENDHTVDALKYLIMDNADRLRLRV